MGRKRKQEIEKKNKWREQFPCLDALAPYEREVFTNQLVYGYGSPPHLEACAALEIAREELAAKMIESEKIPQRILKAVASALRKYAATTEGS